MKISITIILIILGFKLAAQDSIKTIAIIPFYTDGKPNLLLNNEITSLFSSKYRVTNQEKLSQNLIAHEDFNALINLLMSDNYKYSNLTNEQVSNISKNALNADLLLICRRLNQRTITKLNKSGVIKLQGEFVLIDLNKSKTTNISHIENQKFDKITGESAPPYNAFFINLLNTVTKKIE